jgi:Protein of unknown function (DUF3112)
MTIFLTNKKRGHKFIISAVIFGFCMARMVTCIMRIVWAVYPTNISIAIAAQVFVAAAVVLLFIINLIFVQRVIRAAHPTTRGGWNPLFRALFIVLELLVVISIIMLISVVVQSFFTLDANTHIIAHDIQLYGQAYFTFVAFLPLPALALGVWLLPRSQRLEKFGTGRYRTKIAILIASTILLTLGAGFRLGINAMPPRPQDDPAWYDSKACFYIFNFSIDITVVALYFVLRIDKRFYVPDGSKAPGDYSKGRAEQTKIRDTPFRILSEEEVFDDKPAENEEKIAADEHARG